MILKIIFGVFFIILTAACFPRYIVAPPNSNVYFAPENAQCRPYKSKTAIYLVPIPFLGMLVPMPGVPINNSTEDIMPMEGGIQVITGEPAHSGIIQFLTLGIIRIRTIEVLVCE